MDWPKVWLIFATYKRTLTALKTIESLRQHLVYPNLHFHVADDGSGETDDGTNRWHVGVLVDAIAQFYPEVTYHEMDTPPGQFNTGGSVNKAIRAAQANGCQIHLLDFDDWALTRELDIRPMVDVLEREESVGFIRLSYRVPGMAGVCVRYDAPRLNKGLMWLRLIRDWTLRNPWATDSYMVSTQPYIAHMRFFEAYGMHPEHCSPGDAETGLGGQYNESPLGENGPQILFPIGEITVHAPWAHLAARAHAYAAQFGQA
jgi:hypothetical protein